MKLAFLRTALHYLQARSKHSRTHNNKINKYNITRIFFITMIEKICPPALLYLAFSMIQITIDLFQGEYSVSLLKFIVMVIFTTILNMMCINGLTKVVWFIVLIPLLLLTYISSVMFYVFGINPGKTDLRVQKQTAPAGMNSPNQNRAPPPPPPASNNNLAQR
jgi:hypothetical protein